MGERTGIEWTDATWNPIRGCSRVSEGCRNCYAEQIAARFSGPGQAYEGLAQRVNGHAAWTGKVRLITEHLKDPMRWKDPRRVFVNSMSDLFHESLGPLDIGLVLNVIGRCPQHKFQVLTKRPERMCDLMLAYYDTVGLKPFPNLWLGVSVEDQKTANERIPLLLQTPAAVRFVSYEPALGPVDLDSEAAEGLHALGCGDSNHHGEECRGVDWVICGGESGPHARPMHPDWARSVRDQCQEAGVPFFFKQWGAYEQGVKEWGNNKKRAGRLLDGREWSEFPA